MPRIKMPMFVYVCVKSVGIFVLCCLIGPGADTVRHDSSHTPNITLGAFNIKTFGKTKYRNVTLRNHLVTIATAYDLLLIQEIRDVEGTVIPSFLKDCQTQGRRPSLDVIIGPRLGRTSFYQEQYAVLYDTDKLQAQKHHTYPDPDGLYARPPIIIHFVVKVPGTVAQEFVMLGAHLDPNEVVPELNAFPRVYQWAKEQGYPADGFFMGDMNADCSYLSNAKYDELEIHKRPELYTWLVDKTYDTTVSTNTDCAYDRILAIGSRTGEGNVTGTSIDDFDKNMSNELAKKISDHYPIRTVLLLLKDNANEDSSEDSESTEESPDEESLDDADGDTPHTPNKDSSNSTSKVSASISVLLLNVWSCILRKLGRHKNEEWLGPAIAFLIFCCYVIYKRIM